MMTNTVIETKIVKEYETTLERLSEIKVELKQEALLIRKQKLEYKDYQRGNGNAPWSKAGYVSSWNWRHKHIAYCLLRGRTYEQIEGKCREDNKPNMLLVEKYRKAIING